MPDPGRPPDVSTLTSSELERTRRDLAAALALARPGSPSRAPIGTHLAAIDAELASRTSQREALDPSLSDASGHKPGPPASTGLDIEKVRRSLEDTRHLRMALDLLENDCFPPDLTPISRDAQPGNQDRSSVLVATTTETDERSPTTEPGPICLQFRAL